MSAGSTLLRILLSVALMLNGVTGAVAAVHMPGNAAPVAAATAQMGMGDMPCDEHSQAGDSSTASDGVVPTPAKGGHPAPDCCKSGACHCACLQATQATVPAAFVWAPGPGHALHVHPLALGHATPALPHLLRPPIG